MERNFEDLFKRTAERQCHCELCSGEPSNCRNALLPIIAAVGGMAAPVLIHFSLGRKRGDHRGLENDDPLGVRDGRSHRVSVAEALEQTRDGGHAALADCRKTRFACFDKLSTNRNPQDIQRPFSSSGGSRRMNGGVFRRLIDSCFRKNRYSDSCCARLSAGWSDACKSPPRPSFPERSVPAPAINRPISLDLILASTFAQ